MLPKSKAWFSVALLAHATYDNAMAKAKKFDLEDPAPILDDEDDETLEAIDEGIRDADAGRVALAEDLRQLLPKWIVAAKKR